MARNKALQAFLGSATTEDWEKLVADATATDHIGDDIQENYGFSWSAVMPHAADRGFYQRRTRTSRQNGSPAPKAFTVDDIPDERSYIKRTIALDTETASRLQKLEDSKRQFSHKDILIQIIRDGLSIYGF